MTAMSFPPPGWKVEIRTNEPVEHQPVAPILWRKNLKRLRKELLATREKFGPLRCKLFQTSSSQRDIQSPPPGFWGDESFTEGSIYEGTRKYVTPEGQPVFLKHAIPDANGKPIVDSKGRAVLWDLLNRRLWTYVGAPQAKLSWYELADRGGSALLGSPTVAINWIPEATLFVQKDRNRWLWSAFDLAWYGFHPSLRAEKKTWLIVKDETSGDREVFLPCDHFKLRDLKACMPASGICIPDAWVEWPPGYFVSELTDVFQASADLIDVLLTPPISNEERTPNDVSTESSSEVSADSPRAEEQPEIPTRAHKAASQYSLGLAATNESNPTDRQVYDALASKLSVSGEHRELPTFATWQRNLREHRRLTNQQKNKPRAGRSRASGSIVSADQIEPEHLPTRVRRSRKDKS